MVNYDKRYFDIQEKELRSAAAAIGPMLALGFGVVEQHLEIMEYINLRLQS